jgi:hypothetical protein
MKTSPNNNTKLLPPFIHSIETNPNKTKKKPKHALAAGTYSTAHTPTHLFKNHDDHDDVAWRVGR